MELGRLHFRLYASTCKNNKHKKYCPVVAVLNFNCNPFSDKDKMNRLMYQSSKSARAFGLWNATLKQTYVHRMINKLPSSNRVNILNLKILEWEKEGENLELLVHSNFNKIQKKN